MMTQAIRNTLILASTLLLFTNANADDTSKIIYSVPTDDCALEQFSTYELDHVIWLDNEDGTKTLRYTLPEEITGRIDSRISLVATPSDTPNVYTMNGPAGSGQCEITQQQDLPDVITCSLVYPDLEIDLDAAIEAVDRMQLPPEATLAKRELARIFAHDPEGVLTFSDVKN